MCATTFEKGLYLDLARTSRTLSSKKIRKLLWQICVIQVPRRNITFPTMHLWWFRNNIFGPARKRKRDWIKQWLSQLCMIFSPDREYAAAALQYPPLPAEEGRRELCYTEIKHKLWTQRVFLIKIINTACIFICEQYEISIFTKYIWRYRACSRGWREEEGVLLYNLSSKPSSQKYANNYQRKPGNPENFQAFLIFITSQHSVVLKYG